MDSPTADILAPIPSSTVNAHPSVYLREAFLRAKRGNVIALVHVGIEKTLVSSLLVRYFAAQNYLDARGLRKKVVIVHNLSSMVMQHAQAIESHTGLNVGILSGKTKLSEFKVKEIWNGSDCVVITAQAFLNVLRAAYVSLDMISLLVMDEFVQAKKNLPYSQILSKYYDDLSTKSRPKVFAMASTPADVTQQDLQWIDYVQKFPVLEVIPDCTILLSDTAASANLSTPPSCELSQGYQPTISHPHESFTVPSTGTTIAAEDASSLIDYYCALLPIDKCASVVAILEEARTVIFDGKISDTHSFKGLGHGYENMPKTRVKQDAALIACKMLFENGDLNDWLLPEKAEEAAKAALKAISQDNNRKEKYRGSKYPVMRMPRAWQEFIVHETSEREQQQLDVLTNEQVLPLGIAKSGTIHVSEDGVPTSSKAGRKRQYLVDGRENESVDIPNPLACRKALSDAGPDVLPILESPGIIPIENRSCPTKPGKKRKLDVRCDKDASMEIDVCNRDYGKSLTITETSSIQYQFHALELLDISPDVAASYLPVAILLPIAYQGVEDVHISLYKDSLPAALRLRWTGPILLDLPQLAAARKWFEAYMSVGIKDYQNLNELKQDVPPLLVLPRSGDSLDFDAVLTASIPHSHLTRAESRKWLETACEGKVLVVDPHGRSRLLSSVRHDRIIGDAILRNDGAVAAGDDIHCPLVDYYLKEHQIRLQRLDEPVLIVDRCPRNFRNSFVVARHKDRNKKTSEDPDVQVVPGYLPYVKDPLRYTSAEICRVHPIPLSGFYTAIDTTCILHHIEMIALARELKTLLHVEQLSDSVMLEALTTPSANYCFNYERLELFGDAFLKLAVTNYLYEAFPEQHEGQLVDRKIIYVGNDHLFRRAAAFDLVPYIIDSGFASRTWRPPGYRDDGKERALTDKTIADVVESVLGAVCMELGAPSAIQILVLMGVIPQVHHWIVESPSVTLAGRNSSANTTSDHDVRQTRNNFCQGIEMPSQSKENQAEGPCCELEDGEIVDELEEGELLEDEDERIPADIKLDATNQPEFDDKDFEAVETLLNYRFRNRRLVAEALTHVSASSQEEPSFQRLELLGDAVLDYVITNYLLGRFPEAQPSLLNELRQAAVCGITLGEISGRLGLPKYLRHCSPDLRCTIERYVTKLTQELNADANKTESGNTDIAFQVPGNQTLQGIDPPKVLSDIFEAIVGAIFLDCGRQLDVVWDVLAAILLPVYDDLCDPDKFRAHPIKLLDEIAGKIGCQKVKFEYNDTDCNSKRDSRCTVLVHDSLLSEGTGPNRKSAKKKAAAAAIKALEDDTEQLQGNIRSIDNAVVNAAKKTIFKVCNCKDAGRR